MRELCDDRRAHWHTWPAVLFWCALGVLANAFLAGVAYLFGAYL